MMTQLPAGLLSIIVTLALASLLYYPLLHNNSKKRKRSEYLKDHAKRHGYTYSANANLNLNGIHPYGQTIDVLTGVLPVSKNKFDLFFQIGAHSKNNSGMHNKGVLRIHTPDIRSHFFISSKLDGMIASDSSFDIGNYKNIIRLEGSFSDYFKVLAPFGNEQDVYTILTPNVMEYLIKYFHDFDIEIINGETYVYSYGGTSPEKMVSLIDLTDELLRLARLRLNDGRTIELQEAMTPGISRTAIDNLTRTKLKPPRDLAPFIVLYFVGTIFFFVILDSVFDVKDTSILILLPIMIFGPILIGWIYSILFIIKWIKLKRRHKDEAGSIKR